MKKGVSKPVSTGPWYWYCHICKKKNTQQKSHEACFRNYCRLCSVLFATDIEYESHCLLFHEDEYCSVCRKCVLDMTLHKKLCKKKE